MSDTFRIIPYVVRSAGTDVPPEEVQAAINSLAQQTTIALNNVASDPTGPAGGDLSGTYPNPTVAAVHATSGTMSGVTVNSSPIGQTTPAAGTFTTLTATTPVAATSGGTGRNALTANAVIIGEGSSQVNFAAPGAAGGMLISQGAAADPAFANNPTITGGSINSTPVGNTTPSTGAFTTLSATGAVSGAGFTARFSSPGPIGNTTPSTGAFTTLSATTPIAVSSGGTGLGTLTAHAVLLGEGTSNVAFAGPSATAGTALISTGATTDPAFGFPTGAFLNVQTFTATGTYTPTAGTNSILVELVGGGGGGGGAQATSGTQSSEGTGGGAGGYVKSRLTSGFSGVTVTIGTGGTGVSGATGNAGGTSSFGATLTAGGGQGGLTIAATSGTISAAGGVGGTATGGTLNVPGQPGPTWTLPPVGGTVSFTSGPGANSIYGAGGAGQGASAAGFNATGFGAGGSGAINSISQAARAGGNGSNGICIIHEYA